MVYQIVYRDMLRDIQQTVMLKLLPDVFSSVALVVVTSSSCNTTCLLDEFNRGRLGDGVHHDKLRHGTGYVIDERGFLAINYHILTSTLSNGPQLSHEEKPVVSVLLPNFDRPLRCRIVDIQPRLDLAIIKLIDNDAKLLPAFQFSDKPNSIMRTLLVPGNGMRKSSVAVVKGIRVDAEMVYADNFRIDLTGIPMIQTDLVIDSLVSGSPLLNSRSQIVGMTTFLAAPRGRSAGVSLAVPSNILYPEITRILQEEDDRQKWMS